jgi:hypothetical protein
MISRDCIITVNGNTATIDSDIYLYKYDKNIQLVFSIINSKYMYDNDDSNNLIKSMQAAYAQVKFKKDDSADIEIEFDIQATREGAVLLTINEELTDEDTELGEYTIQIRLLDSNKNSVVTLPPVESCIHILAPLFEKMGANTNEVNKAVVNKAVARYAAPLSATTEDGTFNSKTWVDGTKITTAELNRMETGIKTNSTQLKDVVNRLEIIPIKNTHHIIQNGVPVSQQNINLDGTDYKAYLFNDEQITVPDNLVLGNFENKFLALYSDSNKLVNAIVTYNDGTNNITKEVELTGNDYSSSKTLSYTEEGTSKSFTIEFGFDNNTNEFYIYVDDYSYDDGSDTFYEVKNVSLSYLQITNLLDDDYLKSIDYSKIKNIPSKLNALVNGSIKTLDTGEYASLFDNLFIWDANKINEKLDSTSGVKQNQYYNHNIKIKQKDSEGIGYGQYIPASVMTEYKLFVSAGSDVIIKVYNRKSKELITELSDFSNGGYQTITISDSYSDTDGIFIAFTVKDNVTDFYGNTYVNDLVLCNPSGFLTKQDVNNKVDKSQLSFNSNGELVVTIDGVSKTFVPKA